MKLLITARTWELARYKDFQNTFIKKVKKVTR